MKKLALLLSLILLAPGICLAQTTAFTYQGKLSSGGAPASGDYQFEFKLFDNDLVGNQTGPTQTVVASVQNGIFTTRLDFGAASFPADADRWLEISVRPNGSTDAYTVLSPRQQLNSVPFAIRSLRATEADNAANATNADNAASLGGVASGNFVQTTDARLSDARPPAAGSGNYIQNSVSQQTGNFNISGNAVIGGTLTAARLNGDGSGLTNIRASFLWETVDIGAAQAQSNTGYIVTNRGQATITLPRTPSVGDVVRVTSANSGGWKLAQNAGQSILLGSLGLVGVNWTAHESDRPWTAIASSADGTKLVALVEEGPIYTSSDAGLSWIARNSAGLRRWSAVASSADGTKLVAAVPANNAGGNSSGPIFTSTDSGATWTQRNVIAQWSAVASSADGTKLVAVVFGGRIHTSTDSGVTWTQREVSRNWFSVASSADGTKLVAVVNNGQQQGGRIYTSTDSGATWTPREGSRRWTSATSSADGVKLAAVVGGGMIYTSTDSGVTWTPHESNRPWRSIASSADGTKLIAAVVNGQIYFSSDSGVSWSPHESERQWDAVASSADGGRLVAVVKLGQIYTSSGSASTTTTVGVAGELVGGRSTAIELQYIGGGVWMPLSHEGTIVGH
ncbi:MAG: exo-alpha-sialidase [Rubrivivax sp.]|nr:exo-alpha-sialidase [Pyrinomonadaceae bacterium]